jgi:hypothetical protein
MEMGTMEYALPQDHSVGAKETVSTAAEPSKLVA